MIVRKPFFIVIGSLMMIFGIGAWTQGVISKETKATLNHESKKSDLKDKAPQENFSKEDPSTLYQRALSLLQENDIEGAKRLLLRTITLAPTTREAYRQLGILSMQEGEYDDAAYFFTKTLELNPRDPNLYVILGKIYNRMSKFDKAKEAYLDSLGMNPNNFNAVYDLGGLHYQLKEWGKAAEFFEKALVLKPDTVETLMALGVSYVGDNKPEKALEIVLKLKELGYVSRALELENYLRSDTRAKRPKEPEPVKSGPTMLPPMSNKAQPTPPPPSPPGSARVQGRAKITFSLSQPKSSESP